MITRRVGRFFDERLGTGAVLRAAFKKICPDHWSFYLGKFALYCLRAARHHGRVVDVRLQPVDDGRRVRRMHRPFSHLAVAALEAGLVAIDLSLVRAADDLADRSLGWHMVQHLGAPVRLALGALPPHAAVRLSAVLESLPLRSTIANWSQATAGCVSMARERRVGAVS